MRKQIIECKSYATAKKLCIFSNAIIARVIGGYICFESPEDYKTWKNQK